MYQEIFLGDLHRINVLVAGDVMLDRYLYGTVRRISPEAPVPVVEIKNEENRAGGAANVALNVSAFHANVNLIGIVGDDEQSQVLKKVLDDHHVNHHFMVSPQFRTITKLRVISQDQQLIRMDFENSSFTMDHSDLFNIYKKKLDSVQVAILSDYAKGTLQHVTEMISLAKSKNILVFVDPKGKDFIRYRGATILTPNHHEFIAIMGNCADQNEMIEKARQLIQICDLNALLITLGKNGMLFVEKDAEAFHIPADVRDVYDVSGAGDTVIATLATAKAAGHSWKESVHIANCAAGIVVGKLGVATVSTEELRHHLKWRQGQSFQQKILTEMQLLKIISDAKTSGEKIVMTNGCFDILHPGHVTYLEQAKSFGDRLLIAVNDDASISRLKGKNRPINPLSVRMSVLAGLNSVDWVVAFSEDTPAQLIQNVLPDYLVKGGDYCVENIAGADTVIAHGGQVKIIPFVPGFSTTELINKMENLV